MHTSDFEFLDDIELADHIEWELETIYPNFEYRYIGFNRVKRLIKVQHSVCNSCFIVGMNEINNGTIHCAHCEKIKSEIEAEKEAIIQACQNEKLKVIDIVPNEDDVAKALKNRDEYNGVRWEVHVVCERCGKDFYTNSAELYCSNYMCLNRTKDIEIIDTHIINADRWSGVSYPLIDDEDEYYSPSLEDYIDFVKIRCEKCGRISIVSVKTYGNFECYHCLYDDITEYHVDVECYDEQRQMVKLKCKDCKKSYFLPLIAFEDECFYCPQKEENAFKAMIPKKSITFRDIDRHLCIINSIEESKPMISHIAPDCKDIDLVNSLLCEGYIDAQAGLTYEVLAATYYEDGDYTIIYEFNDAGIKIRSNAITKDIVIPIENKALRTHFKFKMGIVDEYYSNDDVIKCRAISEIDQFRNGDFPDDVLALLYKQGLKAESIWVRCEKYVGTEDNVLIFQGRLLNEPFKNFGVHYNDTVTLISGNNADGERLLMISL